jgi:hypothetical protein
VGVGVDVIVGVDVGVGVGMGVGVGGGVCVCVCVCVTHTHTQNKYTAHGNYNDTNAYTREWQRSMRANTDAMIMYGHSSINASEFNRIDWYLLIDIIRCTAYYPRIYIYFY